jgi:hypothetical protein
MHRLIARFLLLVAIVGNFAPLALAATAAPAHACCVRKSVHPCHGSLISEVEHLVIRAAACCNQQCGRAITTGQSADSQPRTTIFLEQAAEPHLAQSTSIAKNTDVCRLKSPRSPPHFSKA